MKITMIATGYVGPITWVCFSGFDPDVICIDKQADKSAMLECNKMAIFEPVRSTLER